MYYGLGANLTLVVHFTFIVFVIFGALLVFASKKIAFIHIPSVIYGACIELFHFICPLTYLENWFLRKAGLKSYSNSFIEQYIMPIVYPNNITVEVQFYLGFLLIFTNIVIYVLAISNYQFMSIRKKMLYLTSFFIVISILLLVFKALNLGIFININAMK